MKKKTLPECILPVQQAATDADGINQEATLSVATPASVLPLEMIGYTLRHLRERKDVMSAMLVSKTFYATTKNFSASLRQYRVNNIVKRCVEGDADAYAILADEETRDDLAHAKMLNLEPVSRQLDAADRNRNVAARDVLMAIMRLAPQITSFRSGPLLPHEGLAPHQDLIVEALANYPHLDHVDLRGLRRRDVGSDAVRGQIWLGLKQAVGLKNLGLGGTHLADAEVHALFALPKTFAKLEALTISDIALNAATVPTLVAALAAMRGLKKLHIEDIDMHADEDRMSYQFGGLPPQHEAFLLALRPVTTLSEFSCANGLWQCSLSEILAALARNRGLRSLDMSHPDRWRPTDLINADFRTALGQFQNLEVLQLRGLGAFESELDGYFWSRFTTTLSQLTKLSHLDLSSMTFSSLRGEGGARPLAWLEQLRHLSVLNLSSSNVPDWAIRELFQAVKNLQNMTELHVGGGPDSCASRYLVPAVDSFLAAHPGCQVLTLGRLDHSDQRLCDAYAALANKYRTRIRFTAH